MHWHSVSDTAVALAATSLSAGQSLTVLHRTPPGRSFTSGNNKKKKEKKKEKKRQRRKAKKKKKKKKKRRRKKAKEKNLHAPETR
jgi:hypothetical protein